MMKIFILFIHILPCLAFEVQNLSLEEKVAQVLMVHFHGEMANEEAKAFIQDIKVGGVIYYNWSNALDSPEQVRSLSKSLQELAYANPNAIPLLIVTDQEGGVVSRLNEGFTQFPGNRAIGESKDPNLAEMAAFAIGQELKAVGINMNLAPVVDVNSNPYNPIIGVRSFGEDPELVFNLGAHALKGYKEAQVIATLKHFPGHGDTAIDSHEDLPILHKPKEELKQVELLPFEKLSSSADAIMTAHILVPAFDEENCSTISEKTLGYLRETIGFQGVIISDSLVMDGILKKCQTVEEAAIRALIAGCDMLILGGKLLCKEHAGFELTFADIKRIHKAIVNAVQTGRLAENRIDQAVQRIFDLKKRFIQPQAKELALYDTESHRAIAQEIAGRALKVTKKVDHAFFYSKKIAIFSPQLLKNEINQTSLLKIGKITSAYFFEGLSVSMDEIERLKKKTEEAEALFVFSYNAWKNPSQITLIQSLIETGKPVVLFVMRDPLDASFFPNAHLIFQTFSPSVFSIQAICDFLEKTQ